MYLRIGFCLRHAMALVGLYAVEIRALFHVLASWAVPAEMPMALRDHSAESLVCLQVVLQRVGRSWVPDFVFPEAAFQPLSAATGEDGEAGEALLAALRGWDSADPSALLRVVLLIIDWCAMSSCRCLETLPEILLRICVTPCVRIFSWEGFDH